VTQENRDCLEKLFESIGPVREKIVRKYISGVSPTIIGRQVGISRQRVEQIIEKSVLLMRKKAKNSGIRNPMEVA
jgi:DNA-directed RNA polymerase specialized sigma subunit